MDPLVLALVVFSAGCFLAFALWPRSSPRDQLEVVPAIDYDPAIGQMKSGHCLDRNYLAGTQGDVLNVILAAASSRLRILLA